MIGTTEPSSGCLRNQLQPILLLDGNATETIPGKHCPLLYKFSKVLLAYGRHIVDKDTQDVSICDIDTSRQEGI